MESLIVVCGELTGELAVCDSSAGNEESVGSIGGGIVALGEELFFFLGVTSPAVVDFHFL